MRGAVQRLKKSKELKCVKTEISSADLQQVRRERALDPHLPANQGRACRTSLGEEGAGEAEVTVQVIATGVNIQLSAKCPHRDRQLCSQLVPGGDPTEVLVFAALVKRSHCSVLEVVWISTYDIGHGYLQGHLIEPFESSPVNYRRRYRHYAFQ